MNYLGSIAVLLATLVCLGCTRHKPVSAEATPKPPQAEILIHEVVALHEYQAGLQTIQFEIGGETRTLLFDTGAGITAISPALADAVGCSPYGRLTGHRMSGERIDMPLCDGVQLRIAPSLVLEPEVVGVFDVASKLPPSWPKLDGVVGLDSFIGRALTIDTSCGHIIVSAPRYGEWGEEVRVRASRPAQGLALDIHVAVPTDGGTLWFILDTGNTGPVIVAQHGASLLGLENSASSLNLAIPGFSRKTPTEVVTKDIIRDGNLGASYLKPWRLQMDLASMRMWAKATTCTD